MTKKETPEERQKRLLDQLERGRKTIQAKKAKMEEAKKLGIEIEKPVRRRKRPKNLDKIVREILDDEELVDKVVSNQPEFWSRLPSKSGGYIISTTMMVKAMGGDLRAAEWIRKTGFGDKVQLESDDGFFAKTDFTIQVIPSKQLDDGINSEDVINGDIKQVEG